MSARRTKSMWTDAEIAQLVQRYPDQPTKDIAKLLGRPIGSVYGRAAMMGLHKSAVYLYSVHCGRVLRGQTNDRMMIGQFRPGHRTWNKGTKFDSGGRSHLTRFQPGDKPHTTMTVGSYRIVTNKDVQQLEQKTSDQSGSNSMRWVPVARLVWEATHGPIPDKSIVIFRAGQRTTVLADITVNKLECLTRRQNMQRNSIHKNGPEIAGLYQIKSAITRQVNRITKESKAS